MATFELQNKDRDTLKAWETPLNALQTASDTATADIATINSRMTAGASFTPSVLTPTAGTITGGTKTGFKKKIDTDLYFFHIVFSNWTQNTSTSTHYVFDLPETTNLTLQPLLAVDLSTGLSIPAWINATTTGRLQVSKTATSAVNILVSGQYFKT